MPKNFASCSDFKATFCNAVVDLPVVSPINHLTWSGTLKSGSFLFGFSSASIAVFALTTCCLVCFGFFGSTDWSIDTSSENTDLHLLNLGLTTVNAPAPPPKRPPKVPPATAPKAVTPAVCLRSTSLTKSNSLLALCV